MTNKSDIPIEKLNFIKKPKKSNSRFIDTPIDLPDNDDEDENTSPEPHHPKNFPFPIDRRPMWFTNGFGGVRNIDDYYPRENKYGINRGWRGVDGPTNKVEEFKKAQEVGCDRIFFNRPAGGVKGTDVSFASWHAIPDYKRKEILEHFNDYILDEAPRPLDLCYYIGVSMVDFRTLEHDSSNPNIKPSDWKFNSNDRYSRMAIRASLGGLMAAGMTSLGLDAASTSENRDNAIKLAQELAQAPFMIRTMGEAIPTQRDKKGKPIKNDKGHFVPDMHAIERMPWLGLLRFYESRFDPKWSVDPTKTELYVWLTHSEWKNAGNREKENIIKSYMDRGFIPIVRGQKWAGIAVGYGEKLGWY